MVDIISTISGAITLAKRLNEISKNIADAEFKNVLADLNLELADVKLRLAEFMDKYATLKEEVQLLRSQAEEGSKLVSKNGMYYQESGDGPFCTGCYDTKRQVVRLVKQKPPFDDFGEFMCPSCKVHYNSSI